MCKTDCSESKPASAGFFYEVDMPDDSIVAAAAKVAPPVIITGINTIFGFTLNDWVAITAIVYAVLQTVFLVVDRLKKRRKRRFESED
jgi:uncharacterized membrane protein